jgi:DNA-binding PadR family transcriptional regulator
MPVSTTDRPATATGLTTTEAAVLALVAIEGEGSRYDLMKQVSRAIAFMWAPAKTQLYTVLPRLAERGFVSARTVREGARPEKQLYQLTGGGRAALQSWLAEEPDSVDTFYLRLFVGGLVPRDVLLRHIEWFRERVQTQLEEYRAIEPTNTREGNDAYHYLLLRLGIERSEHLLRWTDWVEDELRAA